MICETKGILLPEWNDRAREKACVVNFCKSMMDIARQESCGKCVLCREGTWQAYELIRDITNGKASREDSELLNEILEIVKENAGCEMAITAASRCLELINEYQDEWDLHIRRKRCTKGICKISYTVQIDHSLCDGCGKCTTVCGPEAISKSDANSYVIQQEQCTKCQLCISECPINAIKKANTVTGKVTSKLAQAQTLEAGLEQPTTMRRRRRSE